MHIAYDAAPLVKKQKDGVGFSQADAVLTLSRTHPKDNLSLLYFSLRAPKKKRGYLASYLRPNVELVPCPFYSGRFYRATNGLFPLPFSLFFPRRADVTHFFNSLIPPGVRGKKVVTVRDTAYLHYPKSVRPLKRLQLKWNMRSSLARADRIITASCYMRDELVTYYGIDAAKVEVIYSSVDTTRFRADADPARVAHVREQYHIGGEYVLYMGALEPRKNLARLIDAYADLVTQLGEKAPKLVLAGRRGFLHENLERKVAQRKLKDRVIFCGYVAEKDKPYLLAGARAFVFCPLSEGVASPVLEAMACGVPVLTSRVAALAEVCQDAACFADPLSVSQLREGLLRLLTDEAACAELVQAGLERVSQPAFSRTENAEKLYQVYRELCENE